MSRLFFRSRPSSFIFKWKIICRLPWELKFRSTGPHELHSSYVPSIHLHLVCYITNRKRMEKKRTENFSQCCFYISIKISNQKHHFLLCNRIEQANRILHFKSHFNEYFVLGLDTQFGHKYIHFVLANLFNNKKNKLFIWLSFPFCPFLHNSVCRTIGFQAHFIRLALTRHARKWDGKSMRHILTSLSMSLLLLLLLFLLLLRPIYTRIWHSMHESARGRF